MHVRKYIMPFVALVIVGGAAFAAYRTQEQWVPHIFPAKKPASSGEDGGHDDHAGHDHGAREDRVKLSEQAQKNLRLDADTLTPQEHWRTIMIPGMIVDRPGESDRGVPARVAGVVSEIHARPGDTVRSGDPLFTVQLVSELVQGIQAELAKAATDLGFALTERDRVAKLVKADTLAGSELPKIQNQVDRLSTQVNGYRRQLQLFGLTPAQVNAAERGQVITQVDVVAPGRPATLAGLAGGLVATGGDTVFEVKALKVGRGDQVQAGQSLGTLADHRQLLVEGRAFKSEADALAAAAEHKTPIRAEFADETPGAWPTPGPLFIHHLSNQVDPAARTFGFYLPLENEFRTFTRDGQTHYVWRYRPGQRVRLRVPVEKLVTLAPDGKTEVLPFVLPAGAVVREGPEAFVFVQTGDVFVRKPVRVLYEDRKEVVIANDGSVTQAEYVVRNEAAAINRALKAATAAAGSDPHAGHSHD